MAIISTHSANHITDEQIEIVNFGPIIEASKLGDPIPNTITVGSLPEGYSEKPYINDILMIFEGSKEGINRICEDHYYFINWYENVCPPERRSELAPILAYALRGIGLKINAQKHILTKTFNLDINGLTLTTLSPHDKWYPYTLPIDLLQLLIIIVETERPKGQKQAMLKRLTNTTSLFWHWSQNDNNITISPNYIVKRGRMGKKEACTTLTLLEKYRIIECTHRDTKSIKPNTWKFNYNYNRKRNTPYAMILLSNGGVECGMKSTRYNCYTTVYNMYKSKLIYPFITDSKLRRSNSISNYVNQKYGIRRGKFEGRWKEHKEDCQTLKSVNEQTMRTNLQLIELDRDQLNIERDQKYIELEQYSNSESQRKAISEYCRLKRDLIIIDELLAHGISNQFGRTDSGRLIVYKNANPLTASKSPDKCGYSFWRGIKNPLWETDFKSADITVAAIMSGDHNLFNEIIKLDIYEQAAVVLQSERSKVKQLWLAYQYGQSLDNVTDEDKPIAKDLRNYLKTNYPKYCSFLTEMIDLGYKLMFNQKQPRIPTGELLHFHYNKGYALLSIIIQSHVSWMNNILFSRLQVSGYQPVFDIHDSVVTLSAVPNELALNISKELIIEMLKLYNRKWNIPDDARFVKVKPIIRNNASVSVAA